VQHSPGRLRFAKAPKNPTRHPSSRLPATVRRIGSQRPIRPSSTRGEYVTPRVLTVATYLTAWLDGRELRRDAAQSTHERYRSLLLGCLVARLGAVPLQQLAGEQITAYYKWCLGHEITNRKKVEITLGIYPHALPGQDEDAAEVAAGLFSGCSEPTMAPDCASCGPSAEAERDCVSAGR
jgi:hypothetical protein